MIVNDKHCTWDSVHGNLTGQYHLLLTPNMLWSLGYYGQALSRVGQPSLAQYLAGVHSIRLFSLRIKLRGCTYSLHIKLCGRLSSPCIKLHGRQYTCWFTLLILVTHTGQGLANAGTSIIKSINTRRSQCRQFLTSELRIYSSIYIRHY